MKLPIQTCNFIFLIQIVLLFITIYLEQEQKTINYLIAGNFLFLWIATLSNNCHVMSKFFNYHLDHLNVFHAEQIQQEENEQ